ncbi:hypothetical protein EC973_001949 [Apophysomyces ossiformis]|uniref:Uncharacterized protein n=1 Tax=Apophysomyces ossiformis TaxID=679940 RepID=A0A8H7BY10_9FUNG|nr:hypothetical protein EC973_001949 [Apophysomyces ossiformis]
MHRNMLMEIYHCLKAIQSCSGEANAKPQRSRLPGIFRSISSQVSPTPDPTAIARFNLESIEDGDSWDWSPDHPFATSTPIQAVRQSPLRTSFRSQSHRRSHMADNQDDSIGFGEDSLLDAIDLDAIEEAAMQAKHQENNAKRKWDDIV